MSERPPIAVAAWAVVVVALAIQAAMLVVMPHGTLQGDEPYYMSKARYLADHLHFKPATPDELAAERGAWGSADVRPPGYPTLIALCIPHPFDVEVVRTRVKWLQFVISAGCVLLMFAIVAPYAVTTRRQLLVAAIAALVPWPFEFITSFYPDVLDAALAFTGLVALAFGWLFLGALLTGLTLLVRPEMIALAPCIVALAALFNRRLRAIAALAAGLLIPIALQFAYRVQFTGERFPRIVPPFQSEAGGSIKWANSWLGTEHEAYDFVFALRQRGTPPPLPARAFSSDAERREVESLVAIDQRDGYTRAVDDGLRGIADRRAREHPLTAAIGPRVWNPLALWLNVETNAQLLHAMAPLPRRLRQAILLGLLLLKVSLYLCFAAVAFWPWKKPAGNHPLLMLVRLSVCFVILRTLLIGTALNMKEHRYVLTGWLPLMTCALFVIATATLRRRDA